MTLEQEQHIQDLLKAWREERHLFIESQRDGLIGNIFEEMAEYYRAPIGDEEIDALCDIYVFCMNSLKLEDITNTRRRYKLFFKKTHEQRLSDDIKNLMENPYDDVYVYMLMITVEDMTTNFLGYNFYECMLETIKEISSRTGHYDENIHKFIKDKSDEAKAKWYKADYSKCRITDR